MGVELDIIDSLPSQVRLRLRGNLQSLVPVLEPEGTAEVVVERVFPESSPSCAPSTSSVLDIPSVQSMRAT
jgi:hypothetical protein